MSSDFSHSDLAAASPGVDVLRPAGETLLDVIDGTVPMSFHFQPIVDLSRGVTIGYEALARFPGPSGLTPDKWFRIADQLGRRIDLESVTASAALQARTRLPDNCFLSINVGPAFLLSDAWERVFATQPHLGGVVVEITEEESISDYRRIRARVEAIRRAGGFIAIDDAGAGYASLRHVMELAPDFIKLDRAFVSNCHQDRARAALIEMVGRMAGQLNAWIIAEGVEIPDELDELLRLHVPLGQGYFLARPAPQMDALPEDKSRAIAARNRALTPSHTLGRVIETAATFADAAAARQALSDSSGADLAVLLDSWDRPFMVIERHPLLGLRSLTTLMKVQGSSEPGEVLLRALTREAAVRYDPIVAIDERGLLLGVLRMDRLMREALETSAPPGADRDLRSASRPQPLRSF